MWMGRIESKLELPALRSQEGAMNRLGRTFQIVIAVILAGIALTPIAAAQAPRENAKVWPYLAGLSGAERKAVLEREARKDGSIVIYGATGLDRGQFWVAEFNKRYPDIKADFVRLTAEDMVQRVAAEARANRSQADLLFQTINYVNVLSGLLAPFESIEWSNFDKRFLYGGKDKGWASVVYEIFPMAIAWRTDRIPSASAPRTLEQLAAGPWRRRVGTTAHIDQLIGGLMVTHGTETKMTPVLEKLAALENRMFPTHSALSDGLASGEVDIVWNLVSSRPILLKSKGAPVDWAFMDPLYAESNALMLLKDTKKPYAAALFYDVMLSAEVQEASDKWDAGRLFGNRKGKFATSIDQLPSLVIYPPISTEDVRKWNMLKEKLFIRRQ
ncbi:MAG: extracellular solute-binding protein [Alphaproteobacteria bacterium]|nr:extracellular solute-binding protein [Alphaproteobacteria bacterium]